MKASHFAAAAVIALLGVGVAVNAATPDTGATSPPPSPSPNRPDADTGRDAARKPAEVLAFAGVKPGEKVLELIPGGGYFTRHPLRRGGSDGPRLPRRCRQLAAADVRQTSNGVAADPHFANVSETAMSPRPWPRPARSTWSGPRRTITTCT